MEIKQIHKHGNKTKYTYYIYIYLMETKLLKIFIIYIFFFNKIPLMIPFMGETVCWVLTVLISVILPVFNFEL